MRVPWAARRSNQSILKEISPEYSVERLMLKLKLQYFGHLMRRTDPLKKTPPGTLGRKGFSHILKRPCQGRRWWQVTLPRSNCGSRNKVQFCTNESKSHCMSILKPRLPRWLSGKEPTCQCRRRKRHSFDPCVKKAPWRAWQPTPVFLPGESHGQMSLVGYGP